MITLDFKVNGQSLQKEIDDITEDLQDYAMGAVRYVGGAIYNEISSEVATSNHSEDHKGIYLRNLKHSEEMGERSFAYTVTLEDEALFLENGWDSYNLRERMIAPGEHKIIPFDKAASKNTAHGPKEMTLKQVAGMISDPSYAGVVKDLNGLLSRRKSSSSGYVGTTTYNSPLSAPTLAADNINRLYSGIAKYKSQTGRGFNYYAFRTMSYKSKATWQMPKYSGYQIFPNMEILASQLLQEVLNAS